MWRSLLVVTGLLSLGCSSDSGKSDGQSGGGSASTSGGSSSGGSSNVAGRSSVAGGTNSGGELHGQVVVTLHPPTDGDGYTTLLGRFFDGPQPKVFASKVDTEASGCQLLTPKAPFCEESCAPGVCTADNVCTQYPMPVSAGTLSVKGLGQALTLEPTTSQLSYQSPSLAYPPCDAGSSVEVSSDRFSAATECVQPLELTGPDPIPVMAGAPVRLSWKAPASAGDARILIKLDISHHGGSKGEINCDVPDTGEFDIPEALVTKLVGLGLAGFPTINVNRVSSGSASEHPEVSVIMSSDVTRAVDTGVVSCFESSECPDGKMCLDTGVCG